MMKTITILCTALAIAVSTSCYGDLSTLGSPTLGYATVTKAELGRPLSSVQSIVAMPPLPPLIVTISGSVELCSTIPSDTAPVWYHNGVKVVTDERIRVEGRSLRINMLNASDAGSYNTDLSETVNLIVGENGRLTNCSARAVVDGDKNVLVKGFVISGSEAKKILIRAVGPSLSIFGVTKPLAEPKIEIYDGSGKLYSIVYGYPTATGYSTPELDLLLSGQRVGAFDLLPGASDAVELRPMVPGAYTVVVSGLHGTSGVALVEIYEVPTN